MIVHNCWFILFNHVWGLAWIEIHWNSNWLRVWSHTTMLHFGSVLGRPLDTYFWALTISRSQLLACVWSGSQVPSPTHVKKSQHVGKISTCEPQVTTKIWLIVIKVGSWLFCANYSWGLGLRVGSSFLLNPTCNTSSKPHLQKVLSCRHPCHSWDLGLGAQCDLVSPNFYSPRGFTLLSSWTPRAIKKIYSST